MTLTIQNAAVLEFAALKAGDRNQQLTCLVQLSEEEARAQYPLAGTSKGRDFGDELIKWKQAFAGKPQLLFLHTALIIAIRRRIDLQENLLLFYQLWDRHEPFLTQRLDLKWLSSACDTFVDYPRSSSEEAWAFLGALLVKTVKVYETEYRLHKSPNGESQTFQRQMLFDGLLNYNVGKGDLIDHLERRLGAIDQTSGGPPARRVVVEIVKRLLKNDTAFRRIR